jgi:hypothetical protein
VEWAAREATLRSVPQRIVSAASLPKMVVLRLRPEREAAGAGIALQEEGLRRDRLSAEARGRA